MEDHSGVFALRNRSQDKKIHSISTSECKEYHTKQYSKIKEERTCSTNLRIFLALREE